MLYVIIIIDNDVLTIGYTSFFRFDQLHANEVDFDFLFNSFRNKLLPSHERCLIGLTLGFSLWQCSRRDEAIKVYNKIMGLSIDPATRSMSVMFNGGQSTAGYLFDENFSKVKSNLGMLYRMDRWYETHLIEIITRYWSCDAPYPISFILSIL